MKVIEEGNRLDGLSQTHFVGEQNVAVGVVGVDHPVQGVELVVSEQLAVLVDRLRSGRVLEGLLVSADVELVELSLEVVDFGLGDVLLLLLVVVEQVPVPLAVLELEGAVLLVQGAVELAEFYELGLCVGEFFDDLPGGVHVGEPLPLDEVELLVLGLEIDDEALCVDEGGDEILGFVEPAVGEVAWVPEGEVARVVDFFVEQLPLELFAKGYSVSSLGGHVTVLLKLESLEGVPLSVELEGDFAEGVAQNADVAVRVGSELAAVFEDKAELVPELLGVLVVVEVEAIVDSA